MAHAMMEHRNGLAICGGVTNATGNAEREMVLAWLDERRSRRRITLGADKAYDVFDFVQALKQRNVTPHIAINGAISRNGIPRKTAVDRRTTRHPGSSISQCVRKRIEKLFGWIKSTGRLGQLKARGIEKARTAFILALAAYDLIRLPKLLEAPSRALRVSGASSRCPTMKPTSPT